MNDSHQPTARDLNRIRGWLLIFAVLLIPHGVGAPILFARLLLVEPGGPGVHALGLATLLVTAVGNLTGVVLIFSRNRITPAFFTIYLPLLVVLTLLDPDLLATANARMAAVGATVEVSPLQVRALMAVNVILVGVVVAYWVRSERVQAVFGSRGVETLRRVTRG